MGACQACCSVRRDGEVVDREVDLDAPKIRGNIFQKFELSLPFACTYVDTVARRVRKAAAQLVTLGEGDGSFVTIAALRRKFRTPAWSSLRKDDSRITRLLTHSIFSDKSGNISVNKIILFAVLNAAGNAKERSEVLYSIIQDKTETHLTHSDKAIIPTLGTMIRFVTIDLIALIRDIGIDNPNQKGLKNDGKQGQLLQSQEVEDGGDCPEIVRPSQMAEEEAPIMSLDEKADEIMISVSSVVELNYIDPLFLTESRLSFEKWRDRSIYIKQIYKVWYVPQNLRMLIFTKNKIEAALKDTQEFESFANYHNVNLDDSYQSITPR